MLEAINLGCFRSGRKLLDSVSLQLAPGSLTVLAGPNGAGKSTLLKILCGDNRPDQGQVLLQGRKLADWTPAQLAGKRAVMPQETALSFSFTVEQVVGMGRHAVISGNGRAGEAVIHDSMRATETFALRDRAFPTLSGGEKARVTLARVLAQESPLLFLDEPTASLDPRHQHLVMRLARAHADQGGSVLAVLHDLNLSALYADTVVLLKQGRVRVSGPPEQVLTASTLADVFDAPFDVVPHPHLQRPLVLSLPG